MGQYSGPQENLSITLKERELKKNKNIIVKYYLLIFRIRHYLKIDCVKFHDENR